MTIDDRVTAIVRVARGCEVMQGVVRANSGKIMREAIFHFWELRDGPKWGNHRRRSVSFVNKDGFRAYDHAIPLKILTELLFSAPVCETSVRRMLDSVEGVLITPVEHQRLKDVGLQSAMPGDWDGRSKSARYLAAGIELLSGAES